MDFPKLRTFEEKNLPSSIQAEKSISMWNTHLACTGEKNPRKEVEKPLAKREGDNGKRRTRKGPSPGELQIEARKTPYAPYQVFHCTRGLVNGRIGFPGLDGENGQSRNKYSARVSERKERLNGSNGQKGSPCGAGRFVQRVLSCVYCAPVAYCSSRMGGGLVRDGINEKILGEKKRAESALKNSFPSSPSPANSDAVPYVSGLALIKKKRHRAERAVAIHHTRTDRLLVQFAWAANAVLPSPRTCPSYVFFRSAFKIFLNTLIYSEQYQASEACSTGKRHREKNTPLAYADRGKQKYKKSIGRMITRMEKEGRWATAVGCLLAFGAADFFKTDWWTRTISREIFFRENISRRFNPSINQSSTIGEYIKWAMLWKKMKPFFQRKNSDNGRNKSQMVKASQSSRIKRKRFTKTWNRFKKYHQGSKKMKIHQKKVFYFN